MKYCPYVFLILSVFLSQNLISQTTYLPYTVTFSRQSQIDSFVFYYPDVEVIGGNLVFTDDPTLPEGTGERLYDLSLLENLREVKGRIKLINLSDLENLNGLHNIDTTGCPVGVNNTKRLRHMHALDSTWVRGNSNCGGYLFAENNDSLRHMAGFRGMRGLWELHFLNNYSLEALPDLSTLRSVEILRIAGHANLQDLSGLSGKTRTRSFQLGACPSLTDLTTLPDSIRTGSMSIVSMDGLTSLDGLESILPTSWSEPAHWADIGSGDPYISLYINNCNVLTELTQFEHLDTIESLTIKDNASLRHLGPLGIPVLSNLRVYGNDSLLTCDVPDAEQLFYLRVHDNPSLERIGPFAAVDSYVELDVQRDSALRVLDGFHNVSVPFGNVVVERCPQLDTLHLLSRSPGVGVADSLGADLVSSSEHWDHSKGIWLTRIMDSGGTLVGFDSTKNIEIFTAYEVGANNWFNLPSLQKANWVSYYYSPLTEITPFEQLTELNHLTLVHLPNLVDLPVYPSLTSIGIDTIELTSSFSSSNLPLITDCDLCTTMTNHYTSVIALYDMPNLTSFELFSTSARSYPLIPAIKRTGLISIDGPAPPSVPFEEIQLEDNPDLIDIEGLCSYILHPESDSTNLYVSGNAVPFNSFSGFYNFCQPVSTETPPGAPAIRVFPNPVSELLYVELSSDRYRPGTQYVLYDLNGQVRAEGPLRGHLNEIRTGHLSPGIYALALRDAEGWFETVRVVVSR